MCKSSRVTVVQTSPGKLELSLNVRAVVPSYGLPKDLTHADRSRQSGTALSICIADLRSPNSLIGQS